MSSASSAGRLEPAVRAVVVTADAVEQVVEPRIALGRRVLDVDQVRQRRRQEVLVFEARDVLVGRDPPVALPVHADEDVALREVGAVQRARRMRPCPELEHDRGQTERLDRGTCRFALGLQLTEGGAQEDPDALVGSADRRRVSVHGSSVAQRRARPRSSGVARTSAQFQILDDATAAWRHLMVDHVTLTATRFGRAARCLPPTRGAFHDSDSM